MLLNINFSFFCLFAELFLLNSILFNLKIVIMTRTCVYLIISLLLLSYSCTDDNQYIDKEVITNGSKKNVNARLSFTSPEDLESIIMSGNSRQKLKSGELSVVGESESDDFVSMTDAIAADDMCMSEELAALIEAVAPGGMLEEELHIMKRLDMIL